ncbi:MAG: hypothetical protein R3F17_14640 [Planctomycetota bacterium]
MRRDLARQEQARGAQTLPRSADRRHIVAQAAVDLGDRDRPDRALPFARGDPHAARPLHDHGLAMHEFEHAVLRARRDASRAAQADAAIDDRITQGHPMPAGGAHLGLVGDQGTHAHKIPTADPGSGRQEAQGKQRAEQDKGVHAGWKRALGADSPPRCFGTIARPL